MYRYTSRHDFLNVNANFDQLDLIQDSGQGVFSLAPQKPESAVFMDGDDFAGDETTTGSIAAVGGTISGRLDFVDDYDWFAVNLTAGQAFQVVLTSPDSIDMIELLLDTPDGSASYMGVHNNGTDITLTFTPTQTATHYIQVWGLVGEENYTLTTVEAPDPEPPEAWDDDLNTTQSLTLGGADYLGSVNAGFDDDYIAFDAIAGQSIEFTVTELSGDGLFYTFDILNPDGLSVANANTANVTSGNLVYTFTQTGTYYFRIAEGFDRAGDYSISTAAVTDDYSADTATTGVLILDGAATHATFDYDGDSDWFSFTLTEDQAVRAAFNSFYDFFIYDAGGNLIEQSYSPASGSDNILDIYLASGTYFIGVSQMEGGPESYGITLSTLTDDFIQGVGTATELTIDGPAISGAIDYTNDEDWFRIEVTDVGTINFDRGLAGNSLSINGQITLYDSDGNELTSAGASPFGADMTYDFTAPGTYYISIDGGGDSVVSPGTYDLIATQPFDDHGNNNNSSSVLITDGRGYFGAIDYQGDRDWLRFDVSEDGQTLQFIVIPQNEILLGQLQLSVYDVFGNRVTVGSYIIGDLFDDQDDAYLGFAFEFDTAGSYFISVEGSAETTDFVGNQYIIGAFEPSDVHGNIPGDTGLLALDGTRSFGRIDSGQDEDWFEVSVTQGQVVNIDVRDLTEQVPDSFMVLNLYDSDGNFVDQLVPDIDGYFVWTALQSGQFHVGLSYDIAFSGNARPFDYSIHATLGTDDYAADSSTAGVLTLDGGPIDGRLESSADVDWISFTATAGEITRLRITDTPLTSFSFQIYDASGTLIVPNGSQAEETPFIDFTAGETGQYFIAIGAGSTGVQGGYSLSQNSSVISPGYLSVYDVDHRPDIALPDIGTEPGVTPTTDTRQPVSSDITIAASDILFTDFVNGTLFSMGGGNLINDGTIWIQEVQSASAFIGSGGSITNNGALIVMSRESTAYAANVNTVLFTNTGDVFVGSNNGAAIGLNTGGNIVNGGNFRVDSANGQAWGIQQGSSAGEFTNTGDFIVTAQQSAVGIRYVGSGVVDNSGLFQIVSADETSVGFNFFNDSTLTNSGTLTADIAVVVANGVITLTNTGTINGVILATGGFFDEASTITNSGTIRGNILLGDGADTYDGTGGFLDGYLVLEGGNDTAIGGAGSDFFVGGMGDDTLNGGGGDDYAVYEGGTLTSYTLTENSDGSFTLSGDQGTDTLIDIEFIAIISAPDILGRTSTTFYSLADFNFAALDGAAADEYMIGTSANERMSGGDGYDRFILGDNSGQDHISDFVQGEDGINLEAGSFHTLTEIQAAMTQYDGFVVLDLGGGNSVRIDNMLITDFLATDFLVGGHNPDGIGDYKKSGQPLPPKGGTGQKPIDPPSAEISDLVWDDSFSASPLIEALMSVEMGLTQGEDGLYVDEGVLITDITLDVSVF